MVATAVEGCFSTSDSVCEAEPAQACVGPEQCSQGSKSVPNVPNVPNNVPNIPGHGGQDGLLAEGYVAKISMLILATYPVSALDATIPTQNQN